MTRTTILFLSALLPSVLFAQENLSERLEHVLARHEEQISAIRYINAEMTVAYRSMTNGSSSLIVEKSRALIAPDFESTTRWVQNKDKPHHFWWDGTSFGRIDSLDPARSDNTPESVARAKLRAMGKLP